MIILRRELKANLRGLLIWALALALLNIMMVAIFPSMAADGAQFEAMLEMYPETMIKMFNLDQLSMTDPLGFYGVEAYFMVVLFGSIYAAILGSGILAKEEDDKTIEFLLAKPVTRSNIILNKTLAWIIYLGLFNLIIGASTWVAFEMIDVGDFSRLNLFYLLLAPLFIHLTFSALGFLSALFFARRKSSMSVSIGLVLGLYFIHTISLLSEKFESIGWLTPFRYMDAAKILSDQEINPMHTLLLLAVTAVSVLITLVIYQHKDITS